MTSRFAVLAALLLTAGTMSVLAQSSSQRLEQGIYAQETTGNTEQAVAIYRELLGGRGVPEAVLQQAAQRLSFLVHRPAAGAAATAALQAQGGTTRSIVFPDGHVLPVENAEDLRRKLEMGAAAQTADAPLSDGCCGMWSGNYNPAMELLVTGKIVQVQWVNPQTLVVVEANDGQKWGFTLPPPNYLIRVGFNRNSFPLGTEVLVRGIAAKGEGDHCPAALPTACATLIGNLVHAAAQSITTSDNRNLFDGPAARNRARTAPVPEPAR